MKFELMNALLHKHAAAIQSAKVTEGMPEVWFEYFQNEDYRMIDAGLSVCMNERGRKFFPSPGEVRAAVNDLKSTAYELWTAEEVFGNLMKHAARGISEDEILKRTSKYPRIHQCVRAIGWDAFRLTILDKVPFLFRRFKELYETLTEEHERLESLQITCNDKGLTQLVHYTAKGMKAIGGGNGKTH
jgi:hypothetical protein